MQALLDTLFTQGPLGVICALLLWGYVKKDRAYINLYARYAKHMAEDNVHRREMNNQLVGAVNALDGACQRCGYRKFVERIGDGEE